MVLLISSRSLKTLERSNQMRMLFNLENKVAIVTGGMGQLGVQYVKTLISAGAKVYIFDIQEGGQGREALAQDLEEGSAILIKTDITNEKQVRRAFREIEDRRELATILVNNAGIDNPPGSDSDATGPFESTSVEVFEAIVSSHLRGAFLVSREFATAIKDFPERPKNGSIINISSIYGVVAPDQELYKGRQPRFFKPIGYSVAKAGMIGFTRWLAEYLAPDNIRVNALVLGGVKRDQTDDFLIQYSKRTMLGRVAEEHEYNGAVLFLASEASCYMTGSVMTIDGGWTAK